MLKKNYYQILMLLVLLIVFLVVIYIYMSKNVDISHHIKGHSHYFLDGSELKGDFYFNGMAYRNNDELWIVIGEICDPLTDENKEYYRVDVYLDDILIDSRESDNVNLNDYWQEYRLFKRVKFTRDDFKLVMRVYDKKNGDYRYEKEIKVERFV
ncbi:MAG: hypothetical protein OSJ70_03955 [Bacilli bacterium]|nr:hypothetical protein [Bacilli bacterium]